MAGTLDDAGTVRIAYRLFGRRIRATATLIGAKGILTIGVRATMVPVVNDHQKRCWPLASLWRDRPLSAPGRIRRLDRRS
jgi:hypothetical protein